MGVCSCPCHVLVVYIQCVFGAASPLVMLLCLKAIIGASHHLHESQEVCCSGSRVLLRLADAESDFSDKWAYEVVVRSRVTWMLHSLHPLETAKALCAKVNSAALIQESL